MAWRVLKMFITWKRSKLGISLLLNIDRKSYMSFILVTLDLTLTLDYSIRVWRYSVTLTLLFTSAEGRGYISLLSFFLSVCVFVCEQDYSKTTRRIFIKFSPWVDMGQGTVPLNFGRSRFQNGRLAAIFVIFTFLSIWKSIFIGSSSNLCSIFLLSH